MLSVLFFLACFFTSISLFLGGVKDPSLPTDLDFPVFLPLAIADIALIIGFVFFENRLFKVKINIPLIIILSVVFIINLIVIATTPLENTFDYLFKEESRSALVIINNEWKVIYIICFFLLLMNIYISFNYLFFRVSYNKQFIWICLLGVTFVLAIVIYSYITEWETYKLYIEHMATTVRTYNPKSITNNQNSYAAMLLGAAFCSYGLYTATRKSICWILGLFFCINTIFPMSRICLLLSAALTLMIFFYKMIISWEGHVIRNINLIALVLIGIGVFLIIRYNVPEVRDYIENVVLTNDSSINSRTPLWGITISMTQDFHRFIGNGHGYFNTAFAIINDEKVKMPHNLYLQTYGALGFVGVFLFASFLGYVVYKIIVLYKNNRDAALISIIGLVTVLVYYLVEG